MEHRRPAHGACIHDPFPLVYRGKIYLYYKGQPQKPIDRDMMIRAQGVAMADRPEGPFQKSPLNPVINSGHETCLWSWQSGIAALVSLDGPEKNTIQYAPDGLNFDIPMFTAPKFNADEWVGLMHEAGAKFGGIFLLSLTPKGDGSIPPEEQEIMRGIGRWLKVNGEAIYGTRPWTVYAEGPTETRSVKRRKSGESGEQWDWRKPFTAADIRFTMKGDVLYAIALAWPADGKLTIRSLADGQGKVKEVALLGHSGKLEWTQTDQGLVVHLPEKKPRDFAIALKISAAK